MTKTPLKPGAERRRQLRLQKRQDRLKQIWRLVVFTALAGGLGYGLLRQGWTLHSPAQVQVFGSRQVDADQVIEAAGLTFPHPLLTLQPKAIAAAIEGALPVEQVQVSRLMAPPRLRIEVVDREAVARAQRQSSRGLEQGFVDRLGNWMSSRQGQSSQSQAANTLLVQGWQPQLRPALALVLQQRRTLGSDLQEIRFEPGGSLWLKSARLGQVRLGLVDDQLPRRMEVLQQLSQQLPSKVKNRAVLSIDLSDPEQPELGLPAKGDGSTSDDKLVNGKPVNGKPSSSKPPSNRD